MCSQEYKRCICSCEGYCSWTRASQLYLQLG